MKPRKLDEHGRCCGKKPIIYKRDPHYFCPRCDRSFDLTTGEQIENWAYKLNENGEFEKVYKF